jgi:serine/threonine-protein kinase
VDERGNEQPPVIGQTQPLVAHRMQRLNLTGKVLGDRYKLLKRIGIGATGTVYLAEHLHLRKKVAVKVLDPAVQQRSPTMGARFLREAQAAARLHDDHVVAVTDFGQTPQGWVFMAMEHLEGENLEMLRQRKRRLPWPRAKAIVLQMLDALSAAHKMGIVHRDVKPANCFRIKRTGRGDFIKLLDFGIAKVIEDDPDGFASAFASTGTGTILGTAAYIAPEQAEGSTVDHRADLYSVGVILFELLTGRLPFTGKTPMNVLAKHIHKEPPRMRKVASKAGIPGEVDKLVYELMQKRPEDRPQTAEEVAAALRAIPDRPTSSATTFVVVAVAALAGVIGWLNLQNMARNGTTSTDPVQAPAIVEPVQAIPLNAPVPEPAEATEAAPTESQTDAAPETKVPEPEPTPPRRRRYERDEPEADLPDQPRRTEKEATASQDCLRRCATAPGMSSTDRATCRLTCRKSEGPRYEQWSGTASSPGCVEPCKCVMRCKSTRDACNSACDSSTCLSDCESSHLSCKSSCNLGHCTCG